MFLPYCDGSCFTSDRDAPWPVNGSNSSLHFRGLANLDRTLDVLESRFGLTNAQRLVLQGGSAGGLSTYLHLDRVTARLKLAQERQREKATAEKEKERRAVAPPQVVGRPVAGFFIDEKKFTPFLPGTKIPTPSYADAVKYGVAMFNSTPPLSAACKAAHPGEEWRCWMATYASPFVKGPIFAVQSRFDEFQLQCLLGLPCFRHQAYEPPFAPSNCTVDEKTAILGFGAELVTQMQPFLKAAKNGLWLVSCIQHDVNALIENVTEVAAFTSWFTKGKLGSDINYRWVDDCGNLGRTPCNVGTHCAPPHFTVPPVKSGDGEPAGATAKLTP